MKSIGLAQKVLQRINRIFFSFIWKRNFKEGRTFERVKRKIMCQDIEEGGMNMIDINTMQDCFLIKWCLKLIVEQNEKWAALPIKNFEKVGKINTFLCDVDLVEFKGLDTIPNIFWREALRAWLRHSGAEKFLMVQELRSSELPIFNNKGIIYQRKSLLLDEAIKKDIFLVKDVLSDENNILSLEQFITKYGIYPRAHLDYFIIMNALTKFLKRRGEMDDIRERAKYAFIYINSFES